MQGHVYHWKHGWIPLTHYAALQKAHGSHKGAAKYLDKSNGHHGTLSPSHGKATHGGFAEGTHVAYNGRVSDGTGTVEGSRKLNGETILQVRDHKDGKVYEWAPEHVTAVSNVNAPKSEKVDKPAAEAVKAAEATHNGPTIEHGPDGTLVHGTDRSDTVTNGALKAQGFRWSSNLGAWYLPRNWNEQTRDARVKTLEAQLGSKIKVERKTHGMSAAEREAASRERAANRAERMSSRADKLTAEAEARRNASDRISEHIPMGQPILVGHHSEARHRRDLERMHSNMQKSWDAQKEAQQAQEAAQRAERAANGEDPLKRQRRIDRNKAELRSVDKKLENHATAERIIAKVGEGHKAAQLLHGDRLSPEYKSQLERTKADLEDRIAHDQAQIAASGHVGITAAHLEPGDLVHYRGRTHVVKKVNKTTVSVPTGYSWDDKVPINQITTHKKLADLSEGTLKSLAGSTTDPKLRERFVKELNRRGIKLGG